MDNNHCEVPANFTEIESYVIAEQEEAAEAILQAQKCFFYDTCAFRNHMNIAEPNRIFQYIKQVGGIIVITRGIIMELRSGDNRLWEQHVNYIKKMRQYGLRVLVIYEEDVKKALEICVAGLAEIHTMLSFAVKNAKSKEGAVERTFERNPSLKQELLGNTIRKEGSLMERFFQEVRSNKVSGDNLGEELIAICMHMLSNIPEFSSPKYILLTDDRRAITLLGRTIRDVFRYTGKRSITGITTTKLCWLMVRDEIITTKEQVLKILEGGNTGQNIKVLCSEKYELEPNEKIFGLGEFAKTLISDRGLKVYA